MARVEALVLRPDAQLAHGRDERDDRVERVLEDRLEDEVLAPARVLRVVHRAHVQGGDVRLERAQVLDALLERHPDRARRVVDDHVVDGAEDRVGDRLEVLDLVARHALTRTRVDVDHRAALVHDPLRLRAVLLGRVRNRWALVAVGNRAGNAVGDHNRIGKAHAHSSLGRRSQVAGRRGEIRGAAASLSMHSEFRNLVAYQRAAELADELWERVARWNSSARWSVGKQLTRAVDSIGANIAEATGRWHQKDQLRALYVARGELFETEHWITTAERRGLLERGTSDRLDEIARALSGLINKRRLS